MEPTTEKIIYRGPIYQYGLTKSEIEIQLTNQFTQLLNLYRKTCSELNKQKEINECSIKEIRKINRELINSLQENGYLRKENKDLKKENNNLKKENNNLRKENNNLRKNNASTYTPSIHTQKRSNSMAIPH